MAIGIDHALFQTVTNEVFSMGANQYGQLGLANTELDEYVRHPISKKKIYYSS